MNIPAALGIFTILLALQIGATAEDRYVTAILKEPTDVSEFSIGADEATELVYYSTDQGFGPRIEVVKDGVTAPMLIEGPTQGSFLRNSRGPIVAGPCKLRILFPYFGNTFYRPAIFTFKVMRASTPPEKTVVIPPGQGGAVSLQCSSNLVDWVTATNGIYTNVPNMKFFRVNVERIP